MATDLAVGGFESLAARHKAPGQRTWTICFACLLTQAIDLWDQAPDAAVVAGMDRVELLLRAAAAANDSGEVRHAVDLARQAVARVKEARPFR
jgi:hypothetical protein